MNVKKDQDSIVRGCSLRDCFEMAEGGVGDWRALERFHYRSSRCGAVDRVFAMRWKRDAASRRRRPVWCDADEPIGVIVVAMPMVSVAMRNRATKNRYVGLPGRSATLRVINRELRSISRVVIHPQYRGIGLATQLVRHALPRAGTVMVEAMAAMGQVNPFFERAGMVGYDGDPSPSSVRLMAAMEQAGIDETLIADPGELLRTVQQFDAERRQWMLQEMMRFAQAYGKWARKIAAQVKATCGTDKLALSVGNSQSTGIMDESTCPCHPCKENQQAGWHGQTCLSVRKHDEEKPWTNEFVHATRQKEPSNDDESIRQLIALVSSHAMLRPVYYLWRRNDAD